MSTGAAIKYVRIPGVLPQQHVKKDTHLPDFSRVIDDLINNEKRNHTISSTLMGVLDKRLLIVTSHIRHLDLIQDATTAAASNLASAAELEIVDDSVIFKYTNDHIQDIMEHPSLSEHVFGESKLVDAVHRETVEEKYVHRLIGITYHGLDTLIKHFRSRGIEEANVLTGIGGIIMATPRKDIDYILDYLNEFHHPKCLSPAAKLAQQQPVAVYEVIDNNDMLSMWSNWHEEKFMRLAFLDPTKHARDHKSPMTNIVPRKQHTTHHWDDETSTGRVSKLAHALSNSTKLSKDTGDINAGKSTNRSVVPGRRPSK